ncbi:MAG: UDP-N-acetylglucosamine--N-acetylmuramyl-(pentapeptide) pyrophosphoryl-undecaprenol N-acetylglucosamine transferase [Candidatus Pacebacteria bacterium]|jgi:UDP-N-acetylglucosamine--N-acetylmuramyl-(pentapeptide) pyrophosphoryl-undecaprenol N-acetylglucosamine transferase|nr:UDP-N-acetylglucosamine--N-acetylmuramyl-(pentapeptide) pyrophosphoryl-undecaprenol N-acetylglucosamine transferase [Candidatus Paceibacterota bacterium]
MKILFTGGGTGGHFYPIIAVAEKINELAEKEKVLKTALYFVSDSPYDKQALFENDIEYREVTTGKLRRYFSLKNFSDLFKTFFGVLRAIGILFVIYPDVVFSKGGYASFPSVLAARILRIPVVIHESDSVPGRVSLWSAKFAERIAVSYQDAVKFFSKEKTAWTGQPIRKALREPAKEGAYEYLKLDSAVPVIFILGGSSGAVTINDAVLEILPTLCDNYQIIHQTGKMNFEEVQLRAKFALENHPYPERYMPFPFLDPLAMKMSAGAAALVISRAGSTIFEIASWGTPSIIIPIKREVSHDQTDNAFAYARAGACSVVEETNLTPHVLLQEIDDILLDPEKSKIMAEAAKVFSRGDAAETIAREIVNIALSHEK